jgi:uncharacterized protein YbjT (DUF2867 family)
MQPGTLVIGALGNVGTEVVNCLLASGISVRAADPSVERVRARFGADVEAARLEFGDPQSYPAAFAGIQKAFILRPPQISDVRKYMFPAIDAAKAAGVQHFVFLSLIGIEQNTVVPHYQVEQYLKSSGLSYTFLRSSFFMQNLNTLHCAEIRDRDEIFIPVGNTRTSFLDVRDIGAVAALALTQPGHANQAYELTGGEALDYYQVADLFTQVLGRKITYKDPSGLAFFLRQVRQQPLAFALVTTWLYANTRSGMADQVTGEVQRLLNRRPFSMRQYITDYCASWQK